MGVIQEELVLTDGFSSAFSRFMQMGQGAESQLGKLDAANKQLSGSSDYAAKQLSAMGDALKAKEMLYAAQTQRLEAQRQKVDELAEKYNKLAGDKGREAAATLRASEALARAQYSEQAILTQALRTEEAIAGQNEKIKEFTRRMEEAKAAIRQLSANPIDIGAENANRELDQMGEKITQITWTANNLKVFAGTGIGRFQQEAADANSMLERLSGTQDAIARQAYNTNILPPAAFREVNC